MLHYYQIDNVSVYLDLSGEPIVKNFYLDDVRYCKRFECPSVLVLDSGSHYRYTRICKLPHPYNVYLLQSKLIDDHHWQTIHQTTDKERIKTLAADFLSQHPYKHQQ